MKKENLNKKKNNIKYLSEKYLNKIFCIINFKNNNSIKY